MEDHSTWVGVAFFAISAALTAWNSWLTYRGSVLKNQQAQNASHIENDRAENKERDDRTDERVDNMWRSNLRRGAASAISKNMAEQKGETPFDIKVVDQRVREAFQPIVPLLRDLRRQFPDPVKFGEEVLIRHGKWIEEHICDVLGVHDYECMAMAASVSEESTAESKALSGNKRS